MKLLVGLGVVPGHVLIETRGHRTGRTRRTVVGAHLDGDTFWVIAEQGCHSAWVRNLAAEPEVRVRHRTRWQPAHATIVEDDDPTARLNSWQRPRHASIVERFGTQLTTVRLDLHA